MVALTTLHTEIHAQGADFAGIMSSLHLPARSDSGEMEVYKTEEITNGMRETSIERSPRIGSILKGLTERKTTRGKSAFRLAP